MVLGVMDFEAGLLGAAALALANTGVGVAIHQAVLWLVRWVTAHAGSR